MAEIEGGIENKEQWIDRAKQWGLLDLDDGFSIHMGSAYLWLNYYSGPERIGIYCILQIQPSGANYLVSNPFEHNENSTGKDKYKKQLRSEEIPEFIQRSITYYFLMGKNTETR